MIRCNRYVLRSAVLMLLICQVACVASQAPKAQCDSNLRPINPANPVRP
jgi:hypothetical protein